MGHAANGHRLQLREPHRLGRSLLTNFWGFLQQLGRLFIWWVVVAPWEQALRARCIPFAQVRAFWYGRLYQVTDRPPVILARLSGGIHLRLPVVDAIYKQSVRLRTVALPMQTLTTNDGATLTASGVFGYSITDLEKLYRTLHHAEETIRNQVQGAIAQYVQRHTRAECTPAQVTAGAREALTLDAYGLRGEELQFSDFAFVKTHRLIMDQKWGGSGDYLNTTTPAISGQPS